jgi:hypothetical protein
LDLQLLVVVMGTTVGVVLETGAVVVAGLTTEVVGFTAVLTTNVVDATELMTETTGFAAVVPADSKMSFWAPVHG